MAVLLSEKVEKAHREALAKVQLPVVKFVRLVNPSQLSPHQRQLVWKGIKVSNPALATCLTTDPNIAALKEHFNASVVFTSAEINDYTQAAINAGHAHE